MDIKEYRGKMCDGFPAMSKADMDAANDLFAPYLFFRHDRKTGEHHLWTSCCYVNDYVIEQQRTIDPEVMECCHLTHNEMIVCPFCGREVMVKDLSKAGKRKNLRDYRCVVFLHAEEDTPLYAQAYLARKDYELTSDLAAYPDYYFEAAYIFQPGNPVIVEKNYWRGGYYETAGQRTREPFRKGGISWFSYDSYHVIGRDALQRSCMRYSQFETYRPGHGLEFDMMRYLSAYCLYPQLEMLVKMG